MLKQSKIVLSELFNSSLVHCKPQQSSNKQWIKARTKDKGSWASKQAEGLHTQLLITSRSKNVYHQESL